MRQNATSNGNDRSIRSNKKTSLPLPVSASAREVEPDRAGNAGSGDVGVEGNFGRGSSTSDIVKSEGCFGEPEGQHV